MSENKAPSKEEILEEKEMTSEASVVTEDKKEE